MLKKKWKQCGPLRNWNQIIHTYIIESGTDIVHQLATVFLKNKCIKQAETFYVDP